MEIKVSHFGSLMMMLMFSCFLGILDASCFNIAGVDSWMIPILGTIVGFPILILYLYIYNYRKDLNLNYLNIYLFGKKYGRLFNVIILLFVMTFTMITFWNLTSFVASQYLYDTPQWFIDIIFIATTFYFFSKSERTIFRSSLILIYIVLFLYLVSFLGLMDKISINNVRPVLEHGIMPVLKGLYNYVAYVIFPIFTLSVINRDKINKKNLNKWIIITYLVSNFLIFTMLFLLVSVFGIELATLYQYPTYHILKRVFIGGFIERLENVLSIQYIIVLFIPCAFTSYYSLKSIRDITGISKNIFIYPILILIMFISQYIFKSNTYGEYFLIHTYPIFMGIILIVIPIFIALKIRKVEKKKSHG